MTDTKTVGPGGCYILPDGEFLPVEFQAHYVAECKLSREKCGVTSNYDDDYVHYNVRDEGGVRVSFGNAADVYIEWRKAVTLPALRSLRRILAQLEEHGDNVGIDEPEDGYRCHGLCWTSLKGCVKRSIDTLRAKALEERNVQIAPTTDQQMGA